MPALTAKESARYGVRLFGYVLATTLFGGLFVGGGIGLAYLLEPRVLRALPPGPPALRNVGVAAVGGVVVALGLLVFLSGALAIGFTVVSDAVRVGVDRSSLTEPGSDGEATVDDEASTESADETGVSVGDSDPDREPGPGEDALPPEPETEPVVDEPEPPDSSTDPVSADRQAAEQTVAASADPFGDRASEPTAGSSDSLRESESVPPEETSSDPFAPEQDADSSSTAGRSDPLEDDPDTEPSAAERSPDPFATAAESATEDEQIDPADPIADPHSASTDPFDETTDEETSADEWMTKSPGPEDEQRPQAGAREPEAAWREEIEAKLDEDPDESR